MTRILSVLAFTASVLCAQDWARATVDKSPRHREWVTVKHDGRSVQTFVAYPESKDKTPVILVIHEIFGMTDWVEDVADQFAAAGYIAVAPDLLSGMGHCIHDGMETSDLAVSESRQGPPGKNRTDCNDDEERGNASSGTPPCSGEGSNTPVGYERPVSGVSEEVLHARSLSRGRS